MKTFQMEGFLVNTVKLHNQGKGPFKDHRMF